MTLAKFDIKVFAEKLVAQYDQEDALEASEVDEFLKKDGVADDDNLTWGSEGILLHILLGFGHPSNIKQILGLTSNVGADECAIESEPTTEEVADEEPEKLPQGLYQDKQLFQRAVRLKLGRTSSDEEDEKVDERRTPFHAACQNKRIDFETLKLIFDRANEGLDVGDNILLIEDGHGLKPLHYMAQSEALRGHLLEIASTLERPSASAEPLEEKSDDDAEVVAVDAEAVRLDEMDTTLVAQAFQSSDKAPTTILHMVARYSLLGVLARIKAVFVDEVKPELLQYLAKHDEENGATPWHYAVCFGDPGLIASMGGIFQDSVRDNSLKEAIFQNREKVKIFSGEETKGEPALGKTPFVRCLGRQSESAANMITYLISLVSDVELSDAVIFHGDFSSTQCLYNEIERFHGGQLSQPMLSIIRPRLQVVDRPIPMFVESRFRNWEEFGQGGFGRVFTAVDTEFFHREQRPSNGADVECKDGTSDDDELNNTVVVKVPYQEMTDSQRRAFEREAKLNYLINNGNEVHNPYIISCYGLTSYTDKGSPITSMVMECAIGGSLAGYLESTNDSFDWSVKRRMAYQIADGLSFLHNYTIRIIHRDIKTENILVFNGAVKLCDFGLAACDGDISDRRFRPGTIIYLAPELLEDEPVYTEKTDVYALGIVLAELAAKQRPYDHIIKKRFLYNTPEKRMKGLKKSFDEGTPPIDLSELDSSEEEPVISYLATVRAAWAMNSKERTSTAQAVRDAFELGDEPVDYLSFLS